jgi:hypothetical protein
MHKRIKQCRGASHTIVGSRILMFRLSDMLLAELRSMSATSLHVTTFVVPLAVLPTQGNEQCEAVPEDHT